MSAVSSGDHTRTTRLPATALSSDVIIHTITEDTETEREAATTDDEDVNSAETTDEDKSQSDDVNKTEVLDELDDLFALLAQQRRGETLFAQEMQTPDEDIDLAKAAMYVAMHRRPDEARVDDAVEELDQLAAELEKTLPPPEDRFPLRTLKAISRYMFDTLEFKGNAEEFYDPRNSCLDEVLARRTGIPITLSLVYMELAKRVGVPMVGVNLPAHFMIRPVVEDMEVLVDCFNDGELKFVEDVEDMLRKFYTMGEADKLTIDRSFFTDNSVKPRAFLTRLLTNLKQIYFNDDEFGAALQIVAYQSHCAPDDKVALFNRRDGGICLFLMQRYEEALEGEFILISVCAISMTSCFFFRVDGVRMRRRRGRRLGRRRWRDGEGPDRADDRPREDAGGEGERQAQRGGCAGKIGLHAGGERRRRGRRGEVTMESTQFFGFQNPRTLCDISVRRPPSHHFHFFLELNMLPNIPFLFLFFFAPSSAAAPCVSVSR